MWVVAAAAVSPCEPSIMQDDFCLMEDSHACLAAR